MSDLGPLYTLSQFSCTAIYGKLRGWFFFANTPYLFTACYCANGGVLGVDSVRWHYPEWRTGSDKFDGWRDVELSSPFGSQLCTNLRHDIKEWAQHEMEKATDKCLECMGFDTLPGVTVSH